VFPEEIADHVNAGVHSQGLNLWKKPALGQRPISRRQPGIVTRHQRTRYDQEKRSAGDEQRETMHTLIHISDFRLPIADCRLKAREG
jgi:hypothetical protein